MYGALLQIFNTVYASSSFWNFIINTLSRFWRVFMLLRPFIAGILAVLGAKHALYVGRDS
jgi:hypothetical protein